MPLFCQSQESNGTNWCTSMRSSIFQGKTEDRSRTQAPPAIHNAHQFLDVIARLTVWPGQLQQQRNNGQERRLFVSTEHLIKLHVL